MLDKKQIAEQRSALKIKNWLIQNALVVVILLMVVYTAISAPNFASFSNLLNILQNVSVRFIIALGVSGCLIIRGTDLSAGRMVGMAAVLTGLLIQRADAPNVLYEELAGSPILVALVAAIVLGLIFGLINGLIVSFLNVPAFIATLGMMVIVYGLALLWVRRLRFTVLISYYPGTNLLVRSNLASPASVSVVLIWVQ